VSISVIVGLQSFAGQYHGVHLRLVVTAERAARKQVAESFVPGGAPHI
jgi:hypothetical protein